MARVGALDVLFLGRIYIFYFLRHTFLSQTDDFYSRLDGQFPKAQSKPILTLPRNLVSPCVICEIVDKLKQAFVTLTRLIAFIINRNSIIDVQAGTCVA